MNDQTAKVEFSDFEKSLKDKTVLIIGSGNDIDGRRLQKTIDDKNRFDFVARVNKHYGNEQDSGTRTDIIFTRWHQWINDGVEFFTKEEIENAKQVIILNQFINYSQTELNILLEELGTTAASAGLQAIQYFLNRDVRRIYLLGFGMTREGFTKQKRYAMNSKNYPSGMFDMNTHYNWDKEKSYMLQQSKIVFL